MQLKGLKEPVTPVTLKLTVPAGVIGVPEVSVTVVVQVALTLTAREEGLQLAAVEVVCVPPPLSLHPVKGCTSQPLKLCHCWFKFEGSQ